MVFVADYLRCDPRGPGIHCVSNCWEPSANSLLRIHWGFLSEPQTQGYLRILVLEPHWLAPRRAGCLGHKVTTQISKLHLQTLLPGGFLDDRQCVQQEMSQSEANVACTAVGGRMYCPCSLRIILRKPTFPCVDHVPSIWYNLVSSLRRWYYWLSFILIYPCFFMVCFKFKYFLNIVLLRYNWYTINWIYLKCSMWSILTYQWNCTTIKIKNIFIAFRSFSHSFPTHYTSVISWSDVFHSVWSF